MYRTWDFALYFMESIAILRGNSTMEGIPDDWNSSWEGGGVLPRLQYLAAAAGTVHWEGRHQVHFNQVAFTALMGGRGF